jgi:REP element-mobilizing transposase RayT
MPGPRASRPLSGAIPNPDRVGWRSRGYLPHLDGPNLVQHIVFRTVDSLPAHIRHDIGKVSNEGSREAIDAALDQGYGCPDLALPEIAGMVQAALLKFDGFRYSLIGWCVMPNHVHVLTEMHRNHALDRVVHSWKSFSAKQANRLLSRTGPFWAPEYFDRYMRDDEHLSTTLAYLEANPVKAGLCVYPSDWPFSSAWQGWGGRDARGPMNR